MFYKKMKMILLDIDVIIIDEASMLNVRLFYSLMSAIPREAHVIIVGDVDQLPPIRGRALF